MSNSNLPESQSTPDIPVENNESFGELLSQFEQSHANNGKAQSLLSRQILFFSISD